MKEKEETREVKKARELQEAVDRILEALGRPLPAQSDTSLLREILDPDSVTYTIRVNVLAEARSKSIWSARPKRLQKVAAAAKDLLEALTTQDGEWLAGQLSKSFPSHYGGWTDGPQATYLETIEGLSHLATAGNDASRKFNGEPLWKSDLSHAIELVVGPIRRSCNALLGNPLDAAGKRSRSKPGPGAQEAGGPFVRYAQAALKELGLGDYSAETIAAGITKDKRRPRARNGAKEHGK